MNNNWVITGVNSGTLNGEVFSDFQNIAGGPQIDNFTFVPAGVITGTLNGGAGMNSLHGANQNTLWSITGLGTGSLPTSAGVTSFQNIQNAVGGSGDDVFRFNDQAMFYFIDGGGNAPEVNVLDYSLFNEPATVNFFNKTASNLVVGFDHIQKVIGNYIIIDPMVLEENIKVYLALNQTNTFLSKFVPLDLFLYHQYYLKDYEIIQNLLKRGSFLHPIVLQEMQVKRNIFEKKVKKVEVQRRYLDFKELFEEIKKEE
jgi:hypothetical protein